MTYVLPVYQSKKALSVLVPALAPLGHVTVDTECGGQGGGI